MCSQSTKTTVKRTLLHPGNPHHGRYDLTALCASNPELRSYLKRNPDKSSRTRNFGGQKNELWCDGGEIGFLTRMANESVEYSKQVTWFTSLVSKGSNTPPLKKLLSRLGAQKIDVLKMNQGQKSSRLLVWSFRQK